MTDTTPPPSAVSDGKPAKGTVDEGGKYLPETVEPPSAEPPSEVPPRGAPLPPVDRAAAEAKLQEALEIVEPSPGRFRLREVRFSKTERTVSVPARVNMREGTIEYLLTTEEGKKHEALFTTKASPQDFHTVCLLLGVKPGTAVQLTATWERNGPAAEQALASLVQLQDGRTLPNAPWTYGGSQFTPQGRFAAESEGSFISLIPDHTSLFSYAGESRLDDNAHRPQKSSLPAPGVPVMLVWKFSMP